MKRWDYKLLLNLGQKLFAKIYRRKQHCNYNHDVYFLERDLNHWLPAGIDELINGRYDPRPLKKQYLPGEVIDPLYLADRVLQHLLLQVIKPTFKHIMSANCYHLSGPAGVKHATQQILKVLEQDAPQYFIRADIKSFYKSILHHKLIDDIKQHYDDPKLINMLTNIIKNPIETPNGTINPINGIALRGPLSQFFSAIYLKSLDNAFEQMNVNYFRYQDDILILYKTKRQMNRCKRRMMNILQMKKLCLSRRKTTMGLIKNGFHFLGVDYPATQMPDNTNTMRNEECLPNKQISNISNWGGVRTLLIRLICLFILALMPEHCAKPGNR